MKHQIITAPDGSEMVVVPRADYDRLIEEAEDRFDIEAARSALAESDFVVPDAVVADLLNGSTAIAAWMAHRKLSQNAVARLSGISQPGIKRILDGSKPRGETATKIAKALDIPTWALDPAN